MIIWLGRPRDDLVSVCIAAGAIGQKIYCVCLSAENLAGSMNFPFESMRRTISSPVISWGVLFSALCGVSDDRALSNTGGPGGRSSLSTSGRVVDGSLSTRDARNIVLERRKTV